MSKIYTLTKEEARRLAIGHQVLSDNVAPQGKEGAKKVLEQIGYVQIDTLSVVARAHHHVLWSRVDGYKQNHLKELLHKDRAVFEYWAHAAAYLPIRDYRFSLFRKQKFQKKDKGHWYDRDPEVMNYVLDKIKAEGPLMSRDFKEEALKKNLSSGKDWSAHPVKQALLQLFMEGQIMVAHRKGFQKVFDLPERLLPDDVDTRIPTKKEYFKHIINRDIRAHGFLKASEIGYLLKNTSKIITECLDEMEEANELTQITIEGLGNTPFYTRPEFLEQAATHQLATDIHILSPFDNLIIQRKRLEILFDFSYILECYVPKAKRKVGYFSLPLLSGTQFVGQMDLKADRKKKVLRINNLVWESEAIDQDHILPALERSLAAFTRFNDCERVVADKTIKKKVPRTLIFQLEG